MADRLRNFYRISGPSAEKVPAEKVDRTYKKLRMQTFLAATFGYALYYVCRTSLNVMKVPIIDSGLLDARQLGVIGAFLYWAYAVGKFVNGFLADHCNLRRFMATGLILSTLMNLLMGIIGVTGTNAGLTSSVIFVLFAIMWGINGWGQSMGSPSAVVALSRWFPLRIRGTYYGLFSASHNFGEGLSFIFVGLLVANMGWKWGFFGSALAGALGILLILLWFHDTPQGNGLPRIEVLAGEKTEEEIAAEEARAAAETRGKDETSAIQRKALRNAGVWILALSSAFMYMSRYAVNEWGMTFLEKCKGFTTAESAIIIGLNTIFGIIGTVFSGWVSDAVFKGDRRFPALFAGILEAIALALFLFGGDSRALNVTAMILFGIAIGVLISFLGGLMAVDLVPREASGAAMGVVGMASYAAAGLQNIISGFLIDGNAVVNELGEKVYNFTPVSWFWVSAAVISFLLPILNWHRKPEDF